MIRDLLNASCTLAQGLGVLSDEDLLDSSRRIANMTT